MYKIKMVKRCPNGSKRVGKICKKHSRRMSGGYTYDNNDPANKGYVVYDDQDVLLAYLPRKIPAELQPIADNVREMIQVYAEAVGKEIFMETFLQGDRTVIMAGRWDEEPEMIIIDLRAYFDGI